MRSPPIDTYWMAISRTASFVFFYKDGERQNLLDCLFRVGYIINGKHITDEGRQWLEFFKSPIFYEPSRGAVTHAGLIHPSWTEEKRWLMNAYVFKKIMTWLWKQLSMEHVRKVWEQGWNEAVMWTIRTDCKMLKAPATRVQYQMLLAYRLKN